MKKETNWLEEQPRRMMVGFHIPDYDQIPDYKKLREKENLPEILENIDPREMVRDIKEAHGQAFWYYSKCHFGNAYYPSKVGHVHSAIKGRDLFGEFTEACLSENITPLCVYEFSDFRMPLDHPDWCHKVPVANKNIEVTDADQGAQVAGPCLNGPYGDFAIEQALEVVKNYPVKGYLIDFLGLFCFENWICPYCQKKIKDELGFEFHGIDKLDHSQYVKYTKWYHRQNDQYAKKMLKAIRSIRPDIIFTHNFHGQSDKPGMQRTDFASENCDYLHNDLFALRAGTLQISWKTRINQTAGRKRPEILLDSIGGLGGDFLTPKGLDGYKSEMWTVRSIGSAVCSSIIMNIDGTYNKSLFPLAREVYKEQEQYESWLNESEQICDVGIVRSHNTLDFRPQEQPDNYSMHNLAFEGWVQLLISSHLLWDTVPEHMLIEANLNRFNLIILPKVSCLNENAVASIKAYVKNGGKVIAEDDTSLFNGDGVKTDNFQLSEVFGVDFVEERQPSYCINKLDENFMTSFPDWIHERIFLRLGQVQVKPLKNTEKLGSIFYKNDISLVACTSPSEYPGIIKNKFGKGLCFYFAGSVGAQYRLACNSNIRYLCKEMISLSLKDDTTISAEAPDCLEIFAHKQKGKPNSLVISLVSSLSETRTSGHASCGSRTSAPNCFDDITEFPVISDVKINIPKKYQVQEIYRLPNKELLAKEDHKNFITVNLKKLHIHEMLLVECGQEL